MKKALAVTLVLALALSLLAGCGGGGSSGGNSGNGGSSSGGGSGNSSNSSSTSSSGNSSSSSSGSASSSSTASAAPGKIEYDEVIWDSQGVKVTLTGFGRFLGDWCYNFTLENNTDKNISVNFTSRVSVNGCMISDIAANTDRKNFVNAGETRDDTILRFGPDYLAERGITQIQDFELTLFFLDSDDRSAGPLFISDTISLPTPDGPGTPQTFDVDGLVIFDQDGFKATVIRQDYDIFAGSKDGVWTFVENHSGMDVWMGVSPGGVEQGVVVNGKVAFRYSEFPPSNGTIKERDLSTGVRIMEKDSLLPGERLFDRANPVTVTFDDDGKAVSMR